MVYLDAAFCQPTPRPPIWMMRQAGRYMSVYRELRSKHDFLELVKTPQLATDITLQPIRAFNMDAAILFSDILVVAEGLGQHLSFLPNAGPKLDPPIRSQADIDTLTPEGFLDRVSYVFDAIQSIRRALPDKPLIGFAGAPFTVAAYMIEGVMSRDLGQTKKALYSDPKFVDRLVNLITDATITYLKSQVKAGVQAIQLFDTWASTLSWVDFKQWSAQPMATIVAALAETQVPVTVFCKGSCFLAPELVKTGAQVIGLDWTGDIGLISAKIPENIAVQGNLDPSILLGDPQTIDTRVDAILNAMRDRPGFIFNLGHGITPNVPESAVKRVVDRVQAWG